MKQHITTTQLNELSDKGKERLREWWKPKTYDPIVLKVTAVQIPDYELKYLFWKEDGEYAGWIQTRWNSFTFWLDQDWKIQEYKNRSLPLLSIGQMIEFLDEHANGNDFNIRIHSAGTAWKRPGQRLVDIDGLRISEIEDEEELCDALWEAVKNILND